MKPVTPHLAPRLPRRRKRFVAAGKRLTPLSRVLLFARQWKWFGVLLLLGILAVFGWRFGRRHHWGTRLQDVISAGLRTVVDPASLPEILFGLGLIVVLALWWLPKGQAAWSVGASEKNRFDRENEARKTLAQIVGGVLLLAGLYSSTKTFDLQQQGQITDRYTKAIDQLGALAPSGGVDENGSPKINLEVRLGGIYALERIAKDSPKDQSTIMEVLTAYIRQNAPIRKWNKATEPEVTALCLKLDLKRVPILRADIQAALLVAGRRDVQHDLLHSHLNLTWADLNGADLIKMHLIGADLSGTNLREADLIGAKLMEASLKFTDLSGADLTGANLSGTDLLGVDLSDADVSGADLRGAKNLDQRKLVHACGDEKTKLSPEYARPAIWSK